MAARGDGKIRPVDIKRILTNHEESSRRQREADEQDVRDQKLRRALNAEHVERHLRGVIEPVLNDARRQLEEMNYRASVEIVSLHDERFPAERGQEKAFALRFKLQTQRPEQRQPQFAYIEYMGDFDEVSLCVVSKLASDREAPVSIPLPLSVYSTEHVEAQVVAFLEKVFAAR